MCTLTYRLTAQGYQLFFNRDEQRTRPQAVKPMRNNRLNSAFPVDPTGGGTWIGVHENGTSLALLNFYQAELKADDKKFTSRGVIIPHLLADVDHIHEQLLKMDLSVYQAFQLCVMNKSLSNQIEKTELAIQYIWDGEKLSHSSLSVENSLPITSSGVDYENVYRYRKQQFKKIISNQQATANDYIRYHQHQGNSGKCSVKMYREDAHTVSFTQINVNQECPLGHKVHIKYVDYLLPLSQQTCLLTL